MAWEWVAPVSAAGGASIGAVMVWLTSRAGQRHAEELARQRDRQQVGAEVQTRLADAYIDLLAAVEQMASWAQGLRLRFGLSTLKVPERTPNVELYKVRAKVTGYGSGVVREKSDEYWDLMWEFAEVEALLGAERYRNDLELMKRFDEELASREIRIRKELSALVASELSYAHVE